MEFSTTFTRLVSPSTSLEAFQSVQKLEAPTGNLSFRFTAFSMQKHLLDLSSFPYLEVCHTTTHVVWFLNFVRRVFKIISFQNPEADGYTIKKN